MTRSNPTRVQPSAVKLWRLYRFYDFDGRLLYIGQTGRMPLVRALEHLIEQGWAGRIGSWVVDPQLYYSEADVLAAEEAAIRAEKPIHNWQYNEGPHRVWVPKVASYRYPGRGVKPARRGVMSVKWRRRRNWAAGLVTAWAAVAFLLWWLSAAAGIEVSAQKAPIVAAGVTSLAPMLRRCKRRERQLVVAVVTVACAALWLVTG